MEKNDNSGILFINDRKEKETQPDRKGSALIDGVEYWVSAWTKEGRNGEFLSLAFKRKDAPQPYTQPTTRGEAVDEPLPI